MNIIRISNIPLNMLDYQLAFVCYPFSMDFGWFVRFCYHEEYHSIPRIKTFDRDIIFFDWAIKII